MAVATASLVIQCRMNCGIQGPPRCRLYGARRTAARRPIVVMTAAAPQPSSTNVLAKEMERVAAKEALLFAIKDAGGIASAGFWQFGAESDKASIEVHEKILALERLNPTPRPTTSPLLEGLWKFEWAEGQGPLILASKLLLKSVPSTLLSSPGLTLLILDGTAKATYNLKLFGTIDTSFVLTANLSAEGSSRLKEQYIDGVFSPPVVQKTGFPSQLQGIYDQFLAAFERLPDPVKSNLASGLRVPLGGRFDRLLIISYLDEELMIGRDAMGAADVLTKAETKTEVIVETVLAEYQS